MDTPTILMSAIFIMACILPFWLSFRSNRKLEKNLQCALKSIADESNISIANSDTLNQLIFGLDTGNRFLCFVHLGMAENGRFCLDLHEFNKVDLEKKTQRIELTDSFEKVIKLSLIFYPKKISDSTKDLVLFDLERQNNLNGEIQFGEKWASQIQLILNSK